MDLAGWLGELKRRRVFRAVGGWALAAFALLQVAEPVIHGLHLPDWVLTAVVLALAGCFPLVVLLAWAFDLRAGRLERAAPITDAPPTRLRLGLILVGLGLLAAAPGLAYVALRAGPGPSATRSAAPTAPPSIAVLPFLDMSPQHDQEFFSDGVAEEILNALAHVEGLRVIGRTSSFAFKGRNEDLATIAQKLKVGALLEGSVRKEADRIRVTAQLISAADGAHLWSERYERQLTGVFAVQDEIAQAVVSALRVQLLPGQAVVPAARTPSPDAYAQYLLGRHVMEQPSREGYQRAIGIFERSLALDPGYAPAWAALAQAAYWYVQYETTGAEQRAFVTRARAAAQRAVELGPELAEAYAARGFVRLSDGWDWPGAEADLKRALALGPSNVDVLRLYGRWLLGGLGRRDEAEAMVRRAVALDPLSASAWGSLGSLLICMGRTGEGREAIRRSMEISSGNPVSLYLISFSQVLDGHLDLAMEVARQVPEEGWRLAAEALAEPASAPPGRPGGKLEELIRKEGATMAAQVALVYAWRGQADPAFEWLERARLQHDGGLSDLRIDPIFARLKGDPRFAELERKLGLPPVPPR